MKTSRNDADVTLVPVPTAMGTFEALISTDGVRELRFPDARSGEASVIQPPAAMPAWRLAQQLTDELNAYLEGGLMEFRTPLDLRGTPFQLGVWERLRAIPYGQVRSYGEVAVAIGRPSAVRAVGAANGANPVPVIVPCHRVIGSTGKLVGFGAGIDWKLRLLSLENPDLWAGLGLTA